MRKLAHVVVLQEIKENYVSYQGETHLRTTLMLLMVVRELSSRPMIDVESKWGV